VSAQNIPTNELLDRYISGTITAPQEAEMERRAASDPVLADALAGLMDFPEEDHAVNVEAMMAGVLKKVQAGPQVQEAKVRPMGRYLAAASVLLLLAASVFLLPLFNNSSEELAMKTEAPASAPAPAPAPAPVPTPQAGNDQELSIELAPEADADTKDGPSSPAPPSSTLDPRPRPEAVVIAAPVAAAPAPPAITVPGALADEVEIAEEMEDVAFEALPAAIQPIAKDEAGIRAKAERNASETANQAARKKRERLNGLANGALIRRTPNKLIGRITDENGEPIIDALIRLPGLPLGERTDTNGIFLLNTDATTSVINISHPDYEDESLDISNRREDIQITLEEKDQLDYRAWSDSWSAVTIPVGPELPGYALPEEGYNALRERIEAGRPDNVTLGKVKLSFLVNSDGTLEDFVFRGQPSQEAMDYIGGVIARTSIWEVMRGEEAVRVYFKVVFE
jgi:hypothetical protein